MWFKSTCAVSPNVDTIVGVACVGVSHRSVDYGFLMCDMKRLLEKCSSSFSCFQFFAHPLHPSTSLTWFLFRDSSTFIDHVALFVVLSDSMLSSSRAHNDAWHLPWKLRGGTDAASFCQSTVLGALQP